MITLTTPAQINSVLGGNTPVSYDHLVISPLTYDIAALTILATIKISSSSNPTMQAILGRLTVNASTGFLEVEVQQLDFYRRIQMSAGQITSVQTMINNAQNAVEAGLVSMGVISGVQSTGA